MTPIFSIYDVSAILCIRRLDQFIQELRNNHTQTFGVYKRFNQECYCAAGLYGKLICNIDWDATVSSKGLTLSAAQHHVLTYLNDVCRLNFNEIADVLESPHQYLPIEKTTSLMFYQV